MMGIKERNFQTLPEDLSLETLVPKDNFYRRLEESIDLSFIRELVQPLYARGGRHSVDPVVFFKPSQHNAPIEVTPLAAETVRITDSTHPFYGLELPLVGVTRKARIGAVCVVWIRRGVERVVPVEATDLAQELFELPSPCRLSVDSAKTLLAVVASFSQAPPEEAHDAAQTSTTCDATHLAVRDSSANGPVVSGNGGSTHWSMYSGKDVGDAGSAGTGSVAQNVAARAQGGRE